MILQKITVPYSACKAGGTSQVLHDLVYNYMLAFDRVTREGNNIVLYGKQGVIAPTFSELQTVVTEGGSFSGIKLGVKILATKFNVLIPIGMPNRVYLDENEVEKTRTWRQWVEAGNVHYVTKQDNSDAIFKAVWGGKVLPSEVIAKIHTTTGLTVLEWSELLDLRNSADYGGEVT